MLKKIKRFIRSHLNHYNPLLVVYHQTRSFLEAAVCWFPGKNKKIKFIGITGTNGKTTSCQMTYEILKAAGFKVWLISTINFCFGDEKCVNKTKFTTPSTLTLNKLIKQMIKAKCEYIVLEVGSHGIHQGRINNINFVATGITNVTHEHLDYHQTMDIYANEKLKLLKKTNNRDKTTVINAQDQFFNLYQKVLNKSNNFIYSINKFNSNNNNLVFAENIKHQNNGISFTLHSPQGKIKINLNIPCEFNIENALLSSCLALSQKIDLSTIKKGLEKLKGVPGRMETIYDQNFKIMIDYALTPDSLQKMYSNLKNYTKGNIIAIFGSCGDRDRFKRPIMAKIASQYVNKIILTNEDPYFEDPCQIIKELENGLKKTWMKKGQDYFIIMDRKEAIKKGISLAQKNDLIIILGKGAETGMMIKDKIFHRNDKEITLSLLEDIYWVS